MNDVVVRLRGGEVVCGPLWEFAPVEGFLRLVVDPIVNPTAPEDGLVRLEDCESAVERDVWVAFDRVEDVDLLERARREGWSG